MSLEDMKHPCYPAYSKLCHERDAASDYVQYLKETLARAEENLKQIDEQTGPLGQLIFGQDFPWA